MYKCSAPCCSACRMDLCSGLGQFPCHLAVVVPPCCASHLTGQQQWLRMRVTMQLQWLMWRRAAWLPG
jgi:hypothetical protein